jgi:mono/diheme cytochrome c family protein
MNSFKEDRLANEKNDPSESSLLKVINIPLILLALFVGFGVTYLALRTDQVSMKEGDSRSPVKKDESNAADTASTIQKGQQIFTTTCQACHQANGEGIPGTFPPLAGSEWVLGSPSRLSAIILHGISGEITVKGQKFNSVMPTFKGQLSPEDIAAVASYIRQAFNNKADSFTAAVVRATDEKTKNRTAPWAGEVELNSQKWESTDGHN